MDKKDSLTYSDSIEKEHKTATKPEINSLSGSVLDINDTDDTLEMCSFGHLITKFNKRFVYQTYVNKPVDPVYKNSICEIIGYKDIRGIKLSTNTAMCADFSNSQFDSTFTLDNIKGIIKG